MFSEDSVIDVVYLCISLSAVLWLAIRLQNVERRASKLKSTLLHHLDKDHPRSDNTTNEDHVSDQRTM